MSVQMADIQKGVNTAWDASGLDDVFLALREDPTDTSLPVLNDQEAAPSEYFPYCVFGQMSSSKKVQMSGGVDKVRHIREVPIQFSVLASVVTDDVRSAKQIAAYLAEEIMKVFGGHPTVAPTQSVSLDNGNMVSFDYQQDYGVRQDDSEYMWVVSYVATVDVPIMV